MNKRQITAVFSHIPTIETDRLILRRLVPGDAEDMYDYSRLPEVTEYLLWSPHHDSLYTRQYLNLVQTQYRDGQFYDWGLEWKENGRMIGTCGFTSFDLPNNAGEIGYVLHPAYWAKGIAVEAALAVLEYGFRELKLHRIEAKFIYGNDRSLRVMQKLGMTFEGYQRDSMLIKERYRTIGVCAILSDEFFTLREAHGIPFGKKKSFFGIF